MSSAAALVGFIFQCREIGNTSAKEGSQREEDGRKQGGSWGKRGNLASRDQEVTWIAGVVITAEGRCDIGGRIW